MNQSETDLGIVNESQLLGFGMTRSNDAKILTENNERFTDGVDDCVCKCPGVLDVGELFLEHGGDPRRAGVYRTLIPGAPNAAEDHLTLYPLCWVGDTNRRVG